jgi:hypothetical protein
MIDIQIDAAYPARWSKKEKRLFLPFEINSDRPVGAIEVSMEGDGAGPFRLTFPEPRDGRNCRGIAWKPEVVGSWYPLVKAFETLDNEGPKGMRRGPHSVTVTTDPVAEPEPEPEPLPPIRAAFYYSWFVGPTGWGEIGTQYSPTLGRYDLADVSVIDSHIRALEYGKFDAAIATWWGQETRTDIRFHVILQRSVGRPLKWAIYHENYRPEGHSIEQIRADLLYIRDHYASHPNYLKIDGKFVVFAYNVDVPDCSAGTRWTAANGIGAHIVLKAMPEYAGCRDQPDSWHQYGPASPVVTTYDQTGRVGSYNIAPGFWRGDEAAPRLVRDLSRWRQNVREMVASGARWQLVTSLNEWGEGTSVESADEWASASGFGAYLDALHEA